MTINKRAVFIVGAFVVILISVVSLISHLNSLQYVTFNFSNVSRVVLYNIGSQNSTSNNSSVIIKNSGKKIKVSKGDYLLNYTAGDGYAGDSFVVHVGDIPVSKTISPDYSSEKYNSLLDQEKPSIDSVLIAKYPNISSLYEIQRGKLYERGRWYGTTLLYKGDDYFNYDTLRVVMRKDNNQWVVITDQPDINLDSQTYPNVPINILKDINNAQIPPVLDKYKTSQ